MIHRAGRWVSASMRSRMVKIFEGLLYYIHANLHQPRKVRRLEHVEQLAASRGRAEQPP